MEPFYFKSYNKLIGVACDLESLLAELECLNIYDRDAVNYHVLNGHISMWLEYMGMHDLAENLKNAKTPEDAIREIKSYKMSLKGHRNGMKPGRKKAMNKLNKN
ncbi:MULTISPECIES: hypothetical protein [Acidiplasma]|jgi:hypothetical protein|uniref:Uncharacterized protein n=2 Tax=Acidiplasma TaxID=507753 RepID=A0A0Q0WL64_9ARCH|nr:MULTISPECIES: hypothetical protein [Acidiplasma]KJE49224.1 hypothetical protein TZ01_03910 [Acidiplasma sp. MBA-1]KPV47394.1 hypothetical protein SE19_01240 [Acidiplasma aeolicum]KQB33887.1 hypothetical protein AOG54_06260 [Acidiplasma aeolicum]KQB36491.1 hypothetical protein AOG55_03960 [Acidiplasma cupricumulans]WMT54811.1 MAG: hypothetical protein RE470_07835 [Acidiplasma sp.]